VVRTERVGEGNAGDGLLDEVDQLIVRRSTIGSDGDPASFVGATVVIPPTDALWEADPAAGGAGNVARDGRRRRVVGRLEEPRELAVPRLLLL